MGYTVVIASEGTERLAVDAKYWPGPHAAWLASRPCWSENVALFYFLESSGDQVPLNVKSQRITTPVAYLARDGEIVSIVDVLANDRRSPIPMALAKYAVQARRGLFAVRAGLGQMTIWYQEETP